MPSRNVVEIVIQAQDEASDVLESSDSLLGKIGKTAAIGAAAVVGATVAIGGGLLALAKDAAPVQGIQNAFNSLATSAGKNADELVKSMQKQSLGLVDDTDLMLQYNKASQLVGSTLAGQLPDAYQYLAKVAGATGQNVGDLMDTFVSGIGRVTPKMLTQLGITIDQEAVNKSYAASIGKTVEQLTKQDKQTALYNASMEALKKNTASMPDITENAATKMQQFNIKMEDIKETVGVALLPMLSAFMDVLSNAANVVLPVIIPIVEQIAKGFTAFFQALRDGANPLTALGIGISALFGGAGNQVNGFLNGIQNAINSLIPIVSGFVQQLVAWFTGTALPALQKFGNWFTQDVLPVVVQFITGVVIPQIQNFIRILTDIWNMVSPVLFKLADWFINTGLPLVVGFVRDTVIPLIQKWMDGIMVIWEKVQPGLQNLFDWFVTTGLPAITGFIENTAMPIISKIIGIIGDIWTTVAPALGDLFAWFLDTGMPAIVNFITGTVVPAVQNIVNILKAIWSVVSPSLNDLKSGIASVFNWIKDNVIQPIIDTIQKFIDKFNEVKNAIGGGLNSYSGAAQNAQTAANLVSSGQVSPGQFFQALGNAIGSQISGHALGLKNVPNDGLYFLHQGEGVSTAAENQYGGGSHPITINFTGGGAPENQADADDKGFMIVNSLRARGVTI